MLRQFAIISIISLCGCIFYSTRFQLNAELQMQARDTYRRDVTIPYPSDNPYSVAKFELGRSLFFDPLMSGSSDIACSTCHSPQRSWSDGLPRAVGAAHTPLPIRTPTLLNVAWQSPLGWDGKFGRLEDVAFGPLMSKANMNMTEELLIDRLMAAPTYVARFAGAFEDGAVSRTNIEQALATFERSIVSGDSPFDRWVRGDQQAIDAAAQHGFELFNTKAQCAQCHSGWAFTDGSFHDIGSAQGEDIGRSQCRGNCRR